MNFYNLSNLLFLPAGVLLVIFLGACPATAGTRKKTDVIYMKNGDRITCEIKKLEYGQLEVKAPIWQGQVCP